MRYRIIAVFAMHTHLCAGCLGMQPVAHVQAFFGDYHLQIEAFAEIQVDHMARRLARRRTITTGTPAGGQPASPAFEDLPLGGYRQTVERNTKLRRIVFDMPAYFFHSGIHDDQHGLDPLEMGIKVLESPLPDTGGGWGLGFTPPTQIFRIFLSMLFLSIVLPHDILHLPLGELHFVCKLIDPYKITAYAYQGHMKHVMLVRSKELVEERKGISYVSAG